MSWPFIASIIYTFAWSISFYGQIYQNYRLKSVQGFSLDYLTLNISGFIFYTIYSSVGYFTDIEGAGTVVIADLIFVYHAMLMVAIQAYQAIIYEKGKNRISKWAFGISLFLWIIVIAEVILTIFFDVFDYGQYWNPISLMGYCKIVISFIKYTPPAYWNYKRKSTKGWSIFNIVLDLVGGTFSLASGGLSIENGLNFTKIVLAFVTVVYDGIFVIQHYCLYGEKKNIQTNEEKEAQQQNNENSSNDITKNEPIVNESCNQVDNK